MRFIMESLKRGYLSRKMFDTMYTDSKQGIKKIIIFIRQVYTRPLGQYCSHIFIYLPAVNSNYIVRDFYGNKFDIFGRLLLAVI